MLKTIQKPPTGNIMLLMTQKDTDQLERERERERYGGLAVLLPPLSLSLCFCLTLCFVLHLNPLSFQQTSIDLSLSLLTLMEF